MTLRLMPSDPLFAAWDWLLTMRAAWINCIAYDLRDVPEPERAAEVERMGEEMEEAWKELTR